MVAGSGQRRAVGSDSQSPEEVTALPWVLQNSRMMERQSAHSREDLSIEWTPAIPSKVESW